MVTTSHIIPHPTEDNIRVYYNPGPGLIVLQVDQSLTPLLNKKHFEAVPHSGWYDIMGTATLVADPLEALHVAQELFDKGLAPYTRGSL